ncbi:hypothetical protein ES703_51345 [subsurface metagenome]
MTMPYAYIECAGVRVPADCTPDDLRAVLEKRKIRFNNEAEIMAVFGDAIQLKASLENAISLLKTEKASLDNYILRRKELANCPGCGRQWFEEPVANPASQAKKATKKKISSR